MAAAPLLYQRAVDKLLDVRRAACQSVGGVGDRYAVQIGERKSYLWLRRGAGSSLPRNNKLSEPPMHDV